MTRYFDAVDGRGSYWARQTRLFVKQQEAAAKRDRLEDEAQANAAAVSVAVTMATEAQIRTFTAKLDRYDTATVEALMANDEGMALVQAQLDDLFARAHIIEDGRRVFKTRDETQVFDEFGVAVSPDIIRPEDIDDTHPHWEDVAPVLAEQARLTEERAQIIDFQERLDEARDEIADGEIAAEELDALDKELAEIMPPSVAARMMGMDTIASPVAKPTTQSAGFRLPGMQHSAP